MALTLSELDDVVGCYTGLSRKVLDYTRLMKRMVDSAKQPGFSVESWVPLQELIAIDEFERVGNFREVMNWDQYTRFLTGWAMSSEWECSFKRVNEVGSLVFLELQERSRIGDFSSVVDSSTIYEFNEEGKIKNLHVYLQMEMPAPEMFSSFDGFL